MTEDRKAADEVRLQGILQQYWVDDANAPVKRMAVQLLLGMGGCKKGQKVKGDALTGAVLGDNINLKPFSKLRNIFKGTDGQFEVPPMAPGSQICIRLSSTFRAEILPQLGRAGAGATTQQQQKQQKQQQKQQLQPATAVVQSKAAAKAAANSALHSSKAPPSNQAPQKQQSVAHSSLPPESLMPKPPLLQAIAPAPLAPPAPSIKIITSCGSLEHMLMLQHLQACSEVALDCEWSTHPDQQSQLCLVQILAPAVDLFFSSSSSSSSNSSSGHLQAMAYLVDPIAAAASHGVAGSLDLLHSLKPMLQAPATLKVLHDCREDVARLHQACGVYITPVLDTQIAYALSKLSLLSLQNTAAGKGASCGMSVDAVNSVRRIGLGRLMELCGCASAARQKAVMCLSWQQDPLGSSKLWMQRPLGPGAVDYAVGDVAYLIHIARYLNALDCRVALALSQVQADLHQHKPNTKNSSRPEWLSVLRDHLRHQQHAGEQKGALGRARPAPQLPRAPLEFEMQFGENWAPEFSLFLPGLDGDGGQPGRKGSATSGASMTGSEAAGAGTAVGSNGSNSSRCEMEQIDEDAASVLELLPEELRALAMGRLTPGRQLMEVVVDEGRNVWLRFRDRSADELPIKVSVAGAVSLLSLAKQRYKLQGSKLAGPTLTQQCNPFGSDGRMGIPGTLHRISGMKNKDGEVHALTYRIGRHIPGVASIFADLLSPTDLTMGSILLVGKPGVGKTTILRDITKILADTMHQAVIVVDTSNEIAGDADSAHPCIGSARRFMVPRRSLQHEVLVEAVQNHCPDVLVVDEIGTVKEVQAAKTISQRGVRLIGTAHGHDIHSLMKNPELLPLLGGIESVTLGDEEAKRTNQGQKVKLVRKGPPVFDILIEVLPDYRWVVHRDVASSVDQLLASQSNNPAGGPKDQHLSHDFRDPISCQPNTELRRYGGSNGQRMLVSFRTLQAAENALAASTKGGTAAPVEWGGQHQEGAGLDGAWLSDLLQCALLRAASGNGGGGLRK